MRKKQIANIIHLNDEQRMREAAEYLGENVMKMFKAILMKHDRAVIEAGFEAVMAERERCASIVERMGMDGYGTLYIAQQLRSGDDYQNQNAAL
jgi:hypothetical protein